VRNSCEKKAPTYALLKILRFVIIRSSQRKFNLRLHTSVDFLRIPTLPASPTFLPSLSYRHLHQVDLRISTGRPDSCLVPVQPFGAIQPRSHTFSTHSSRPCIQPSKKVSPHITHHSCLNRIDGYCPNRPTARSDTPTLACILDAMWPSRTQ
jgi:hypothetical protein